MSIVLPEHLPLLAAAPDGIQKLRGLILGLAVRGKLVPQYPNDESATALLVRIAQERARLEGVKTRKTNNQNPVDDWGGVFELPESWVWVGFGEIALHNAGKTLDSGRNSGQPRDYITTSNLYWGRFELGDLKQMLIGDDEVERCTARKNDLLICEGGEAGRAAVWPYDRLVCFQNHVHRARFFGGIDPYFVYYFFEWLNASGEIAQYRKGVGISNMSGKALASIPFPLPPIAEQRRIVAKLDELMALCDRLEAEQADAESAQAKLVETLLGKLIQSPSAADLAASRQRLGEHFDTLFTTESSIDAFRQTILQLAVMGKLVRQDPSDEPVRQLLKNIARERTRLEAEGISKKTKSPAQIANDEQPFELPKAWEWVPMSQLVSILGDGLHGTPVYSAGTSHYFVNGNNLVNGRIVIKPETKTVSEQEFHKHKKPLSDATILVSINGTLGRVAYYHGERVILGKSACFFNLLSPLNKNYIRLVLESQYFFSYAYRSATGSTIKNLGLKAMNEFPVPVPPLAEQQRIVSKVDEIMALCARLKAGLVESRRHQERLASTLIEAALQAA